MSQTLKNIFTYFLHVQKTVKYADVILDPFFLIQIQ